MEKVATLENAVKRIVLDMTEMHNSFKDVTKTNQLKEQDMNSKENLAELVNQKVQEALQQQNRTTPSPHKTLVER